ncbi:uncharacterized protein LOC126757960 isoform X1 [Bactrocera neohumeralis]|uniref:uncharacterized protein LOC120773799 isoform X1 n=1 Tax=Bactrocera tryoni TaxID=59916 RepID=UPI001A98AA55|nr:uncharacterized protein LOC120773799 isoform X1 [Bactrocera tryoni]XP_050327855.1 uncharacterized protein LOC126757960 isoform X1 [Bactrocera neohumeralis]
MGQSHCEIINSLKFIATACNKCRRMSGHRSVGFLSFAYTTFGIKANMSTFGAEFEEVWPKPGAAIKLTEFGTNLLQKCLKVEKPDVSRIDIKSFIKKSSNFPVEFGTNTCRVISQPKERYPEIEKQIASAYPIIHERVLGLYLAFLEHKCKYGNKRELELYQNLTLTDFVQRLLAKRCVSFFGKNDKYLLLSRHRGCSGFLDIGTDGEKPPLLLEDVLCYDEIKLSAFLSVSSHTEFLNDGNRQNCGVIERNKSRIETDGVIIGLIGARLVRRDVMEYQDIIITSKQNTKENGYGLPIDAETNSRPADYRRVWKQFYDERDYLYEQVTLDGKRFGNARAQKDIFDNVLMKKRYTISFDTLLLESEARAAAAGKQAYIHVVGIGLGVWRAAEQQEKVFLETFAQRLKLLLPKLSHIGVVHFSWFKLSEWGDLKHGGIYKSPTHPDGGIRTFLSKRNPADKLVSINMKSPELENMLLIVSYAWDGNALPGNEFWMKMLKSTGDSSTACSTLVTELHNPHINTELVNGANLHIASEKYGVLHIADYVKNILE